MLKKILSIFLLSLTFLTFLFSSPTFAENTVDGAKIFEAQCVGCHVGGGNIIRRGKTLKQKALQSNHVDTLETMESFVAKGKKLEIIHFYLPKFVGARFSRPSDTH